MIDVINKGNCEQFGLNKDAFEDFWYQLDKEETLEGGTKLFHFDRVDENINYGGGIFAFEKEEKCIFLDIYEFYGKFVFKDVLVFYGHEEVVVVHIPTLEIHKEYTR